MGRTVIEVKGDGLKLKNAIESIEMTVPEFAEAYDIKRSTLFYHVNQERLNRAYKLFYSDLLKQPIEKIWPREKPYCS